MKLLIRPPVYEGDPNNSSEYYYLSGNNIFVYHGTDYFGKFVHAGIGTWFGMFRDGRLRLLM